MILVSEENMKDICRILISNQHRFTEIAIAMQYGNLSLATEIASRANEKVGMLIEGMETDEEINKIFNEVLEEKSKDQIDLTIIEEEN
jgi:hypothetical protein